MACCVVREDAGNLILDQTSELELVIYIFTIVHR